MIDSSRRHTPSGFRHEAVLYHGADEFLDGTLQFVRDGFEAGEPILVAVVAAEDPSAPRRAPRRG